MPIPVIGAVAARVVGGRLAGAVGRGLMGPMSKKFGMTMFAAGLVGGLAKNTYQATAPYVNQFINDNVSSVGASSVNTNRNGWMGTKNARAPLGATGDLALAAHRLRNRG
jgi:hypothetical protein